MIYEIQCDFALISGNSKTISVFFFEEKRANLVIKQGSLCNGSIAATQEHSRFMCTSSDLCFAMFRL